MDQTQPKPPALTLPATVVATGLGALAAGVMMLVVLALTGVGGLRVGWLWCSAPCAAVGGGLGWAAWSRRRGRAIVAAALAASGLVYGLWIAAHTPIGHARLRQAMDSVAVPADFSFVSDSEGGIGMCFDVCPNLTRTWVVPGERAEVEEAAAEAFRRAGFSVGPWTKNYELEKAEGRRGRVSLRLKVGRDSVFVEGERFPIPPGKVVVDATLDTV